MNAGLEALIGWIFNILVKQEFLAGKRMYLGGASTILGGVVIVIDMVINGTFSSERMAVAWAAFSLGYTVLGQAGKQDKIVAALTPPEA